MTGEREKTPPEVLKVQRVEDLPLLDPERPLKEQEEQLQKALSFLWETWSYLLGESTRIRIEVPTEEILPFTKIPRDWVRVAPGETNTLVVSKGAGVLVLTERFTERRTRRFLPLGGREDEGSLTVSVDRIIEDAVVLGEKGERVVVESGLRKRGPEHVHLIQEGELLDLGAERYIGDLPGEEAGVPFEVDGYDVNRLLVMTFLGLRPKHAGERGKIEV